MKILKSWLEDYVRIAQSDDELSDLLSYSGTLVDNIQSRFDNNIIVAEIRRIVKHPGADKLRIATVFDGTADLQIVCGASNIAVGQKVPLAKIGAVLPEIEIKEVEIRGVKSSGMLCSKSELGIDQNDQAGIFILPNNYHVGRPLNYYLPVETVFDLEITPNRGDCLSHIGIAREIAAVTNQKINIKKFSPIPITGSPHSLISVDILDQSLCPRYYAINIENITVKDSPQWLQDRLLSLGQKPVSNIVDITNYIMLDLGQPLHAFDTSKISGRQIIIRPAQNNETITTLSDEHYSLIDKNLVITDSDKPIAIAGIIGANNSHVENKTTNITLEAAEFNPVCIRKTSKSLNLSTEAGYRFERGIDPLSVEMAIDKAAGLITEICGGKITGKFVNIARKYENPRVGISYDKINKLLGTNLSPDDINKLLLSLGFSLKKQLCQAPSWRHDISCWQDLAEEVARLYDINKIAKTTLPKSKPPKRSMYYYEEFIKDFLIADGFTETINYPFLSQFDVDNLIAHNFPSTNLIEITNPLQDENKYMRHSLIPGLLKNISKNPTFDPVTIFEIGHVFSTSSEKTNLGICAAGKNAPQIIDQLINKLADQFRLTKKDFHFLNLPIGKTFGYKIKKSATYLLELPLQKIIDKLKITKTDINFINPPSQHIYRPLSKYPPATRDLAFLVNKKIATDKIADEIYNISSTILFVELFDEFIADKFGHDQKNVAFHIYMQNPTATMNDEKVNIIITNIINKITNQFDAILRS